ncbi:MAG: CinA family protein [Sphingomonadales bacterium]|nr:CinA family protein [Sphingomonadales bacterium]
MRGDRVGLFAEPLNSDASLLLEVLRSRRLRLATAESCTGGLIAAMLTEIPGSSDVFERGFVTYSNEAKAQMLGVDAGLIAAHGAVSREVALAMAAGALAHSLADVSVAVTGFAGPRGGSAAKPIGLVHVAAARRDDAPPVQIECRFGDIGRSQIRLRAVAAALN